MDEEENIESVLLKRIASAVILQAIKDLSCDRDSYRFKTARNFCLGTSDGWAFSRKVWSDLADIEESKIKEKSMEIVNAV